MAPLIGPLLVAIVLQGKTVETIIDVSVDPVTVEPGTEGQLVPNLITGTCITLFWVTPRGHIREECADGWEDVNPYSVQFDYPGDYSVELYVTNNLSSHFVLAALHVDQQVTYGQLTILPVNVNSASHMYLNITSGTRVTLTVDWQDNSTEQLYLENITDVVHLTHSYFDSGHYEVDLVMTNTWGSTVETLTAVVESPVECLAIVNELPSVVGPPAIYNVTLSNGVCYAPTNLICEIRNGSIAIDDGTALDFNEATSLSVVATLPALGWFDYILYCFNSGSFQAFPIRGELVSPILNMALTVGHHTVPLCSSSVVFSVSMDSGSNVTTAVNFGNGELDQFDHETLDASLTQTRISHMYCTIGNYTVNATSCNKLGCAYYTLPAQIQVLNGISWAELTASSPSLSKVNYTVCLEGDNSQGLAGVTCVTSFPDETSQTLPITQGPYTECYSFDHTYSPQFRGFVNATLNCSNLVSQFVHVSSIEIREPIFGVSVNTSNDVMIYAVTETITLTLGVMRGSHVTCDVTVDHPLGPVGQTVDCTAPVELTHSYGFPGNYTLWVDAGNEVSVGNNSISLIIQQPVTIIAVTSDFLVATPPGNISYNLATSPPYPSDPFCKWQYSIDHFDYVYAPDLMTYGTVTHVHQFPQGIIGPLTTTVNCSNLVSFYINTIPVFLMRPIIGPTLVAQPLYIQVGMAYDFQMLVFNGSHVTYNISYGDGESWSTSYTSLADNMPIIATHTYQTPGGFCAQLTVANLLGVDATPPVCLSVRNALIEDNLVLDVPKCIAYPDGVITWGVYTLSGKPIPRNVTLKLLPGDASVTLEYNVDMTSFVGVHTYTAYISGGYVEFSIYLNNIVSDLWLNESLIMQRVIDGLQLTCPEFTEDNSATAVVVQVTTGSHFNLTFSLDTENGLESFPGELYLSHDYIFPEIGNHTLYVFAFNHVSNESEGCQVLVQHPVDMDHSTPGPVAIGEDMCISSVSRHNKTGSVSFDVDYGDGTSETIPNVNPIGAFSICHPYQSPGAYHLTVVVSNRINQQSFAGLVNVETPVTGVNFTVSSPWSDAEDGVLSFWPYKDINFLGTFETGTNVQMAWVFGEFGILSGSSEAAFHFKVSGYFTVTFTVYNSVSSTNASLVLLISSPVGLMLFDHPGKVYRIDGITINVAFDVPKNICLHFNITGPVELNLWQETLTSICRTCEPHCHVTLLDFTDSFEFHIAFSIEGDYSVCLYMNTEWKWSKICSELHVQKYACENPTVVIPAGVGDSPANPRVVLKSTQTTITTEDLRASTECRETSDYLTQWDFLLITGGGHSPISSPGVRVEVYFSTIYERALDYGIYAVRLTVLMKEFEMFNGSDSLYIEIRKSPLQVSILPGPFSMVGNTKVLVLDTGDRTLDPDTDAITGMSLTWICFRTSEGWTFQEDAAPLVSVPLLGSPAWSGPDLGGCFGTGPGQFDTNAPVIMLDHASVTPDQYLVTLIAAKDDRITRVNQTLLVVARNPIQIHIERDQPEYCPEKFSRTAQYEFVAVCGDCTSSLTVQYTWSLRDELGVVVPMEGHQELASVLGGAGARLTLNPGLLVGHGTYLLEVRGRLESGDREEGFSKVHLPIARPPFGGSCHISQHQGRFLETVFRITCEGWKDDDVDRMAGSSLTHSITAIVGDVKTPIDGPLVYLPLGDPLDNFGLRLTIETTNPCSVAASTEIAVNVTIDPTPDLETAIVTSINSVVSGIDLTGAKLTPTLASSLITSAVSTLQSWIGVAGDTKPTTIPMEMIRQTESGLLELLKGLLLSEDPLPNAAVAALTKAGAALVNIMSHNSLHHPLMGNMYIDDILEIIRGLIGRLGDMRDPDFMKTGLGLISMIKDLWKTNLIRMAGDRASLQPDLDVVPAEDLPPEEMAARTNTNQQQARSIADVTDALTTAIGEKLLAKVLETNRPASFGGPDLFVAIAITTRQRAPTTKVQLPNNNGITLVNFTDVICAGDRRYLKVVYLARNIYSFDETSTGIGPGVVQLDMYGRFCQVPTTATAGPSASPDGLTHLDYRGLFIAELDRSMTDPQRISLEKATMDEKGQVNLYLPVRDQEGGYVMDFVLRENVTYNEEKLHLLITTGANVPPLDEPNQTSYDVWTSLPTEGAPNPWSYVLPESEVEGPGIYIRILAGQHRHRRDTEPRSPFPDSDPVTNTSTFPFDMLISRLRCRTWDAAQEKWRNVTCKLDRSAATTQARCACTSATVLEKSISTGFVPPTVNMIDFAHVLGNFAELLNGNPAVFSVILCTLGVYVVLVIWARRADKGDIRKWGVMSLLDNPPAATHHYQISVLTGVRQNGGTTSRVRCIISGENMDTGVRMLDDGQRTGFPRGSTRRFLLSTMANLGPLSFCRVWHDNSGKGVDSGWFLDKVIIEDLQTRIRYYFLAGQWLAVDEDAGRIDRILAVAGREQIVDFKNLFFTTARKKVANDHLWVSIFARPDRSNFTRVQRLTSAVALLFVTMLADAMWYKTEDTAKGDQVVHVGGLVISGTTLYISVMASLCAIPISTIVIIFFQRSRPKPPKRDDTANLVTSYIDLKEASRKTAIPPEERLVLKKYKRKYPLPYWCVYVAWSLAILAVLLSSFFVILYSLQWGKEKAEEWMTSFFLSFFQSLLIIQPFKVIILAIIASCIFKKLDEDDEKSTRTEAVLKDDEETIPVSDLDPGMLPEEPVEPVDEMTLAKARKDRIKEKLMHQTIKELVLYTLFLILIMYIAWGSKESHLFNVHRTFNAMLNSRDPLAPMPLWKVSDGRKFWKWCRETLVENLYWQKNYDGSPTTLRAWRFLTDFNYFRMGTARLRQLRTRSEPCPTMLLDTSCRDEYNIFSEEDRDFTLGWTSLENMTTDRADWTRLETAFHFQGFLDLQNILYAGTINTYGGGGYVADLGNSSQAALFLLNHLLSNNWVDRFTRAVFFEMTLYNANINGFAFVVCMFEFSPTGGVFPRIKVDIFNVYSGLGVEGTAVLACIVIWVLILIYLIVHEAFKMRKMRRDYLKHLWNPLEVLFILFAVVAVGMYGSKEAYGRYITSQIHKNKNANMGYMQLAAYEHAYTSVVGGVVFVATLKCLRLFKFSASIRHVSRTVSSARKEILSYSVVFTGVYVAFSGFGYLLFGSNLYDYSTFMRTLQSLYSTLLGTFDFHALHDTDRYLGPIYLFLYAVTITIVLLNLFIGILCTSFSDVRRQPMNELEDQVFEYMGKCIKTFFKCGGKKDKKSDECQRRSEGETQRTSRQEVEETADRQVLALLSHLDFLEKYIAKNMVDDYVSFYPWRTGERASGQSDPARTDVPADIAETEANENNQANRV